jgi:hypothetical protein
MTLRYVDRRLTELRAHGAALASEKRTFLIRAEQGKLAIKEKLRRQRRAQDASQKIVPTRPYPAACEACGRLSTDGRQLHVDHCHVTGVFRGWLCSNCNLGLGKLGDTVGAVERMLAYLKRAYSDQ